jgi:hypothetical protein
VGAIEVQPALGGQQEERGELQVGERLDRPTVLPVGGHEAPGVGELLAEAGGQTTWRAGSVSDRRLPLRSLTLPARQHPGDFNERRACGAPRGGVLPAQQFLRLRGPRHQLAVEREPVGVELRPPVAFRDRLAEQFEETRLGRGVVEEAAAGAGVDDSGFALDSEPPLRRGFVPAHDHHRPRAHVLLLADDAVEVLVPVVGERLGGVFEELRQRRRLHRRHRRRQINEPARVGREPRHHLQRRGRVLLADHHPARELRLDRAAPGDVGEVEQIRIQDSGVRIQEDRRQGRICARLLPRILNPES